LSKRKINKGFLVLNKGERIAVISLLTMIVILLGFSVFRPMINYPKQESTSFHNLDSLLAVKEALIKKEAAGKTTSHEEKPPQQKSRRSARQSPNTNTNPTPAPEVKALMKPEKPKNITMLDINTADSISLITLPQIGEVMASRIHRYRNRLGGFVSMEQLFEVKGMDQERFETIKPYIYLEDKTITKIHVNQDEFKTLLRHPYLEYEQVKAIVNHRERKGLIQNWEQLQSIVGEVNPRLEAYVSY